MMERTKNTKYDIAIEVLSTIPSSQNDSFEFKTKALECASLAFHHPMFFDN